MPRTAIYWAVGAVAIFIALLYAMKTRPPLDTYRAGPDNLGVGVYNMAREKSAENPLVRLLPDASKAVQRAFSPYAPSTMPSPIQALPDFSLRGNGVYLSGDLRLTPLSAERK